jgi:hypothetical protein
MTTATASCRCSARTSVYDSLRIRRHAALDAMDYI